MEQHVFTISDLNDNLKNYIETSELFKSISIKGEIANLTFNKSGHIYLSLKDPEAKIDCAIWKSNAFKFMNLNLTEGTEVIATGTLSFYKPTSKLTFVISDIKIDGVGELAILYQKRFNELKEKGWFNSEIKKHIPKYPENIGIVTAATGDAVRDLITTIRRRYPVVNIFLFPASVQGDNASLDIAKKIRQANNFEIKLDTLIVGRGGGSYEDLWSFNELELLEAVYQSKIPVISGVGHEPDETLCDYVADLRASTPTASGEKATPDINNVLINLSNLATNFSNILLNKLENSKNKMLDLKRTLEFNLLNKINFYKSNLENYNLQILNNINNKLFILKQNISLNQDEWKKQIRLKQNLLNTKFNNLVEKINLLSPYKPLEKGYAILEQNNKVIRSIDQIDNNHNLKAIIKDGIIDLTVNKINKKGDNK